MSGGKTDRKVADEALERALAAYHDGRYYEAESVLYKLIWTMELNPEDHILARTLLGNSLRKMGRTAEAEKELKKAVEIANQHGRTSTQGDLLLSMGKLRFRKGELEQAIDLLNKAGESYRDMGNNEGIGRVLIDLGMTEVLLGKYEKAERKFKEAISFIRASGDKVELIRALHNLAYVYFHLKDYFKAKERLYECKAICDEVGEGRLCIHTYSNLGHTCIKTRDLDKAAEYLRKAGELLDTTEDEMCRLNVRWVQGLLMGEEGQLDGALDVFEEIGQALEKVGAPGPMVEFILDYIPILVRGKRLHVARELLDRARRTAQERFKGHYMARIEEMDALVRKADS